MQHADLRERRLSILIFLFSLVIMILVGIFLKRP